MVVISVVSILAALILPVLARSQEAARRASCQNNLRQWGLIFAMYASESRGGLWPPLQASAPGAQSVRDVFAVAPLSHALMPEYTADYGIYSCPSDLDSPENFALNLDLATQFRQRPWLAGRSYAYLGWVIDKADRPPVSVGSYPALLLLEALLGGTLDFGGAVLDAQLVAGLNALLLRVGLPPSLEPNYVQFLLDQDITGVGRHPATGEGLGVGGSDSIFRLRNGIERFCITDVNAPAASAQAQSGLWVMFDQFGKQGRTMAHQPGGANVLYMDGHVSYVPYLRGDGSQPPLTSTMAATVGRIGNLR